MAQSGRATRAENVCFEWKNGRDANGPLCLLLTRCGHSHRLRSDGLALFVAASASVGTLFALGQRPLHRTLGFARG